MLACTSILFVFLVSGSTACAKLAHGLSLAMRWAPRQLSGELSPGISREGSAKKILVTITTGAALLRAQKTHEPKTQKGPV